MKVRWRSLIPEVATLAMIMRRITNFLFDRMTEIWGGKAKGPENAQVKYAQINGKLVNVFEVVLVALEGGGQFTEKQVETLVKITEIEINKILDDE